MYIHTCIHDKDDEEVHVHVSEGVQGTCIHVYMYTNESFFVWGACKRKEPIICHLHT